MAKQSPSHHCEKQAEISILQTEMKDLNKVIKDNGQPGLQTTVTRLAVSTETLIHSVDDLKRAISAINKFMSEYEGERKRTERNNIALKWIVGTLLTVITVLFGAGILK